MVELPNISGQCGLPKELLYVIEFDVDVIGFRLAVRDLLHAEEVLSLAVKGVLGQAGVCEGREELRALDCGCVKKVGRLLFSDS